MCQKKTKTDKYFIFEFPRGAPGSWRAKTLASYKTHKEAVNDAYALMRTGKIKNKHNIGVSRSDGKRIKGAFIYPWLAPKDTPRVEG